MTREVTRWSGAGLAGLELQAQALIPRVTKSPSDYFYYYYFRQDLTVA